MQNTTTRRRYDRLITCERIQKMAMTSVRKIAETCGGHRLTTARLCRRDINFDIKLFQQLECRYSNLRVELINIARNKKGNFHDLRTCTLVNLRKQSPNTRDLVGFAK